MEQIDIRDWIINEGKIDHLFDSARNGESRKNKKEVVKIMHAIAVF